MKYLSLLSSAVLVLTSITIVSADNAADEYVEGTKVRRVVKLNEASFRRARNDAMNPIFLYMFSAYWCGHCKRLTPVLESVAPQVAGRLAIAKIDCTEEKKLCDEFGVRGYPTLKFSMDGEMYDYTLGRTEEDLVGFADKMSRPVVKIVETVEQANQFTSDLTFGHGVSFLCHDPAVASHPAVATVEQLMVGSPLIQTCKQVARSELAYAHFTALATKVDTSPITGVPMPLVSYAEDGSAVAPKDKGGFVCRLELGVPARCLLEKDGIIDLPKLQQFVKVNNVATLTELGPGNFHRIGRLGRPLVIGVAEGKEGDEKLAHLKADLKSFVINGPPRLTTEKYYFGWMDATRWATFLKQFDINVATCSKKKGATCEQPDLPQIFVLDVPKRKYWQDLRYKDQPIQAFLTAIDDGIVPSKTSDGIRGARFLTNLANGFYNWLPWSLLLILAIAAGAVFALVPDAKEMAMNKVGKGGKDDASAPVDTLLGKKQQ